MFHSNSFVKMSDKSFKDTTTQEIFEILSKQFEITYDQLLKLLREEAKYKRLLRIGEQQFFEAPIESTIEEESQKSRLCFAKINLLSVEIDTAIDKIINEKLKESDFLSAFKREVLRAVLHLYSKEKERTLSNISEEEQERKKNEEKTVLENIKHLSKYCAENINDIRKQVIEMPVEQPVTSAIKSNKGLSNGFDSKKINSDDSDIIDISFGSVSSVHTSDLSSFEDDIVMSSDDELGIHGGKISLKTAEEKLEEMKFKKEIKEEPKASDSENKSPSLNSSNEPGKNTSRCHRLRKPNKKFADEDTSTVRKESIKPYNIPNRSVERNLSNGTNHSKQLAKDNNAPRKRGRPRKYFT